MDAGKKNESKRHSGYLFIIPSVMVLAIAAFIIVLLSQNVSSNRYEERKSYFSALTANSAAIVSETLDSEAQKLHILASYLQNDSADTTDAVEYIRLVGERLGINDRVIEIVDSSGHAYGSDGYNGRVLDLRPYTASADDYLVYIIDEDGRDSVSFSVCLRERLAVPVTVAHQTIEYCAIRVSYEEIKDFTSFHLTFPVNLIIADKTTGNTVYASYEAGAFIPGTNVYSKLNRATYLHGESSADLIAQAKAGENITCEIEHNENTFFVSMSQIEDTQWVLAFASLSDSLSVSGEKFHESMVVYLLTIMALFFVIIFYILLLSLRRNSENKLYAAEHSLSEIIKEDRDKLAATNIELNKARKAQAEQQVRLEDALHMANAANRAKTTFLNSMSHDIRTPMNAIIGFAGLASSHIDDKEAVISYLGKIKQSSGYLLSLINDVLDMSRIESGKMVIHEEKEELSEILHTLRSIVASEVNARKQCFTVNAPDIKHEHLICDKLRLNQILLNVVSNAIKYTPEGGSISVTVTEDETENSGKAVYEFRVKDNGIGMSPEFAATVFDAFTREQTATVSGIQGTGLGMAITKNIVDMMGGTVRCESEKGKGSEFIIRLPFSIRADDNTAKVPDIIEGRRAFVIGKNESINASRADMLRKIGLAAENCASPEAALALCGPGHSCFAVFIEEEDTQKALETVHILRSAFGEIPFIYIISDKDTDEERERATAAGVTACIVKPVFPSDIVHILSRKLEKENCGMKAEETNNFKGKRILLAEDNELNQEIAVEVLEEAGFIVETADNGKQACDMLLEKGADFFDLVLMDIQMPVMDGHEATRCIRKFEDKALASVPIVAMTANAFEEDKKAAMEAGMNGFITKPIDTKKFFDILRSVIG